ncbi:hypothetical protein [Cryptosporangium sp. NPDC051539]|uniref:hypothetical protein n=1 Tax=Cryptosporangium sp. NPDC051539 TaxID=3363962 RepID=UPI0037873759
MDYEREAAALYALPPGQFTTARDVRIAELRGENQAALAGRLKLLRRPTMAAWCVNLLVGSHRDDLVALTALGARLADAQRRADLGAIRTLSAERRQRIATLVEAAGRLVAQSHPRWGAQGPLESSVIVDLESTLNAAVADAAVAQRVLSGRLVRAESYAGFGPLPESSLTEGARRVASGAGEPEAAADSLAGGSLAKSAMAESALAESALADQEAVAARCERDAARRGRDVARHARDEAAAVLAEATRRLAEADRGFEVAERALLTAEDRQRRATARLRGS